MDINWIEFKCPSQRRDPKFKRKCPANGVRYLQQEDIEARRVMDCMAGWPLTCLGHFLTHVTKALP